jgi:hypothetical protein
LKRDSFKRDVGVLYQDNLASFVVTPIGNVLARPEDIDEDDAVKVWVLGAAPLLSQLSVKRTSTFGLPGGINVLGEGVDIAVAQDVFQRQAAGVPPECAWKDFRIDDFAPGRGQVEISAVTAAGEQTSIGEFDFGVNTLFQGAISLGVVYSRLGNPSFDLVFNGQDSVITQRTDPPDADDTKADGDRFLWGLFYHAFFPKRDVEKEPFRLSPVLGLALNDVSENFFVGGSVDGFGSAYLTVGAHFGRITDLDERSGLKLGDAFDGASTAIPTVRKWKVQVFAAASIDVRAALRFLRVAVSGVGSSAGGG